MQLSPQMRQATEVLGDQLRSSQFQPIKVAHALGVLAWSCRSMDSHWWRRKNLAEGPLWTQIELLIRGGRVPIAQAHAAFEVEAWESGVLVDLEGQTQATGTVLPLASDLIWTDRADRAFVGSDGIFLPDSTTLTLRRCLPEERVGRHLDLGAGGGAVALRAARWAEEVLALDLNPRCLPACQRSAALSKVHVQMVIEDVQFISKHGSFDRITFVLPLLWPWRDLPQAPLHTVARRPEMLAELISILPDLLNKNGLALLYCQNWAGPSLVETISRAFKDRQWRGAFWWDYMDETAVGPLKTGVLAIQLDQGWGWTEAPNEAPEMGNEQWWPEILSVLEKSTSRQVF